MTKNSYNSVDEVAENFAKYFLNLTKTKNCFNVALSGGSTPKVVFDFIAKNMPTDFNWKNIHFWWGDERCVPPTNDESNYKMTKERLFDLVKIPESNIHRVLGENDPLHESERYSDEIKDVLPSKNELPYFDLIILGMGDDGHTASIFPHQMVLLKSAKICDVATHPDSGQKRVTITGATLNNAREIAFLVTGANKKEKIEAIFNQTKDYEVYPAAHIKPIEGNLSWFMDKAAWGNS